MEEIIELSIEEEQINKDLYNEVSRILKKKQQLFSIKNFAKAIDIAKIHFPEEVSNLIRKKQLTHIHLAGLIRPILKIQMNQRKRRNSFESIQLKDSSQEISTMHKKPKVEQIVPTKIIPPTTPVTHIQLPLKQPTTPINQLLKPKKHPTTPISQLQIPPQTPTTKQTHTLQTLTTKQTPPQQTPPQQTPPQRLSPGQVPLQQPSPGQVPLQQTPSRQTPPQQTPTTKQTSVRETSLVPPPTTQLTSNREFDVICSKYISKQITQIPSNILDELKQYMIYEKINFAPSDNENMICKKYLDKRAKEHNMPFAQAFAQKTLNDEADKQLAFQEAEKKRLEEEAAMKLLEQQRVLEEHKRIKKEYRVEFVANIKNNFADLSCSDRIVGHTDYFVAADEALGYTSMIGIAQPLYNRLVEASSRDEFNAPLLQLLNSNGKSVFVRYQPLQIDEESHFIFVSPLVYAELQGPETIRMKWCTTISQAKKINFVAFDSEGIEQLKEKVHEQLEQSLDKYSGFIIGQSIPINVDEQIITLVIEKIIDSDGISVPVAQAAHAADVDYDVRTDEEAFDENNRFNELPDEIDKDSSAMAFGMAIDDDERENIAYASEINNVRNDIRDYARDDIRDDIRDDMEIDNDENIETFEGHNDFGFFEAVKDMTSNNTVAIIEFNDEINDDSNEEAKMLFKSEIIRGSVVVAVYDQNENAIRIWARGNMVERDPNVIDEDERRMYLLSAHGRALDFLRGGDFVTASTFSGSWLIHDTRGLFIIGSISENGQISYQ